MAVNPAAVQKGLFAFVMAQIKKQSSFFFVMTGLILTGIEKILETEFTCPCLPGWNKGFSVCFFMAPSLLLFVVMLNVTGCKWERSWKTVTSVLKSLVPPVTWITLLFLDGRYYMCLRTYWSGRLVKDYHNIPEKWCKPVNETSEELEDKARWWFSESQFIGMILISVVSLIYLIGYCYSRHHRSNDAEGQQKHQDDDAE